MTKDDYRREMNMLEDGVKGMSGKMPEMKGGGVTGMVRMRGKGVAAIAQDRTIPTAANTALITATGKEKNGCATIERTTIELGVVGAGVVNGGKRRVVTVAITVDGELLMSLFHWFVV